MGATQEFDGNWWYFCVGVRGYHTSQNLAIDVFADADAPCYDPGSTPVIAPTKGWTWGPESINLLGGYYRERLGTCETIKVQAVEWGGQWQLYGREAMYHSYRDTDEVEFYIIPLGSWSWQQASPIIGYTVWDSDCGSGGFNAYHVHQTFDDEPGSPVTLKKNPLLQPDTVYPQWNGLYFIHRWEW